MKSIIQIALAIMITFIPELGQTEEAKWEIKKQEDGITVSIRRSQTGNFMEYKSEMELKVTAEKVLNTIKDTDNAHKWLHNCKTSKLLKRISVTEQYNYNETQMPFPYRNHDMIFKMTTQNQDRVIRIKLDGLPDYLPAEKDITRMKKAKGGWILKPVDNNRTLITYRMEVDPGGLIPSWLANTKIVEIPFNTFKKLKRLFSQHQG